MYYSAEHTWYYFKDLRDDEVILFRNSDSTIENGGGKQRQFPSFLYLSAYF
jgi:hypothetical protein